MERSVVVADDLTPLASVVGDDRTFLDTTFGRHPWHGKGPGACELFSIDDVDAIVSSGIRVPAIRMVRGGERVPPAEFCTPTRIGSTTLTDTADARKVLDLHRRGATLVLQSLQRTWPSMVRWCCSLEEQIGWPIQANAYLTPAHQRGLHRHADRHDVLAVQLHGSKRWWVDGLGDLHLRAGDVLYLPAGTEHVAETDEEPSLHLTIGIHRATPERIARAALELAHERAGSDAAPAAEQLSRLAVEFGRVGSEEAIDRLRRPTRTSPVGELARSVLRGEVHLRTCVRRAAPWELGAIPGAVDATADRIVLTWAGRRLLLPARTRAALDLLARGGERGAAIGDLPGLEDDECLMLARRLLDEGALDLTTPPPAARG